MRLVLCDLCGEGMKEPLIHTIQLTPPNEGEEENFECCENCWNLTVGYLKSRASMGIQQRERVLHTAANLQGRGSPYGL